MSARRAPKTRNTRPATERPSIDDLDRALVERLRRDGRESNRSLAAALGVNEATIANRLRRLEAGSIMRVVALTDMEAFGYGFLVFVKLRVGSRSIMAVGEELSRLPEVISVTVSTGRYDVIATVLARDREHLGRVVGVDVAGVQGVEAARCELAIDVLRFESMWALLQAPDLPTEPFSASDVVDELDHRIIELLQRDARSSNRRIADEAGVSEGTIRARIRRMEDERLIRIQAVSDVVAFGVGAHAYVGVQVAGGKVPAVGDRLLRSSDVAVLARTIGEFDFVAVITAPDRDALVTAILGEISGIPGVRHTETFESWRTLKHAYTWARLV
ncbi:MAG: transcriptional regulator, AsnC family [Solirubrobacterales bacterium]|nr:transcriptional regulator, AsnC family [Solirubrobacterales bacterium]